MYLFIFFQVCLLIAFLCVRNSVWTDYSTYRYFEVITICFMILILVFYAVSLFRIYRMLTCVSWPLTVRTSMKTFVPNFFKGKYTEVKAIIKRVLQPKTLNGALYL